MGVKWGIFDRLPWWHRTQLERSKALHPREAKSMAAELNVLEAAKKLPGVVSVHHGIRIPNPQMSLGSGEVDVVVITNRACLLIEVKNFIGTISLQDGDIIQYKGSKPRSDSKEILPLIQRKASDLQRWGASLFGNASLEVVHLVVLSNPQAELEYNVLNHPNVATLKTLEAKVSYLLQSHPELHHSEIASVQTMAEMFGTWDTLETEAGLVVNGDIIDTDLPEGWTRKDLASVEVEILGGKWKTLLRGPKISVTLHRRDGTAETIITRPTLSVRHRQPWGKSGLDGKGLYPLEHFSRIVFGHENLVEIDEKGFRTMSIASQHLEKLPQPSSSKEPAHEADRKALAKRYPVGTITSGVVQRHLKSEDGSVHGMLVSLVERELNCLLPHRVVREINPDFLDAFYSVGAVLEVRITENRGPGKIRAELV